MQTGIFSKLILLLAVFPVSSKILAADSEDLTIGPRPYYYFSSYQTSDGLPSNSVLCIVQDNDGFLWIGTRDGICRYDGCSFNAVANKEKRACMGGVTESLFVDHDGLLWFSTDIGRGFYNTYSGEITELALGDKTPVNQITEDGYGNIWFCSDELIKYCKETGEKTLYRSGGISFSSIASDTNGNFWCTRSDGRLLRYDSLVDKFKEETPTNLSLIAPISGDRLLATTSNDDVVIVDLKTFGIQNLFHYERESGGRKFFCLMERIPGEFWLGTPDGIIIYNEESASITNLFHSGSERMSLSSDYVFSLFPDREGNVWVGTYYGGLNLWHDNKSTYFFFYPIDTPESIAGKLVRTIKVFHESVWVGTQDGELNSLEMGSPAFKHHVLPGVANNYHDILPVGNELWIATYGNGLFRYDPETSTVTRHYHFANDCFTHLLQTSSGDIFIASTDGVFKYIGPDDSFEQIMSSDNTYVLSLCEDSNGKIWVGSRGQGVLLYDSSLNLIDRIENVSRVTSLYEDKKHRMWVTSEGEGVDVVNINSFESLRLTRQDGLPSNITCATTEDNDGMIWLSTDCGLCVVNPEDFHIHQAFFHGAQTEASIFTYGAVCNSTGDNIFLGTTDGLLSFSPAQIKSLGQNTSVFITSIIGISENRYTELSSPGRSAAYSDRIVTSYKNVSSLSIDYSYPDYSALLSPRFRYSLTSRGQKVSSMTSEQHVLFSNIGYGRHIFTVSLVDSDRPESSKTVEIIVRPPFWKSIFAKILTVLAVLAALFCLWLSIVRRRREKQRMQEEELEKAKQKNLYESKNAFFTNITHEIRTPLSLIKMPLDRMIKSGNYSEKDLLTIQANTDRLLDLTNQLLDIRKLEQKEEKLEFTRRNVCDIVHNTCRRFRTTAEEQGICLEINIPDNIINAMCAADSIEKIVSNLVSNALKYGKDRIIVSLTSTDSLAIVRVDSNGERIPSSEKERIFQKFIHGGKGTGLGLPLSKTLAEMHHGRLYLDDTRTDVNSFVLELPLEQPESIKLAPTSTKENKEKGKSYDDSRKGLMIVEDNQDFRLYLAEALSEDFNVFTAANGKAAVEVLKNKKIDLIVSDIMMPVMDGCELCNYVKSTIEYSHIPVILLTAAVGMDTRIETLQVGADGYIEKPFPIELLQANITNLFKNRDIANRLYTHSPLTHLVAGNLTNKMDEDLMSRLNALITEKMSESSMSVDELSSALNVSNSTLFRKVKANTGMNPNEYIRLCRLKRAAELLASRKYRINEVADMVGFSSSSYFAANFQKQFNISPSAFVKGLGADKGDQ